MDQREMKVNINRTIRVLMFYDLKGWAWWHRINNIAKNQPGDITIDALQINADFNHHLYDFIIIFDSFLTRIISKVPGEKLIIGCSCPKIMKEFLNALFIFKPLAGLVNNQEMYYSSRDFYKIFYCPNGVDADLFKPKINKINSLTACWVGNSRHFGDKGLDNIRHVCNEAKIPLITFDRSNNQNGLLLPHIELRDKVYYKSSFYICFSEYEGTPNPALEALSCGLPVISTKVGNMPEIIEDGVNGFFSDRNENSLFNALMELKKSDIRYMSVNARNSILNGWTWHNRAKNYTNMLRLLKHNREMSNRKKSEVGSQESEDKRK
jgi:glycosyltransferase involved in cell wall biosynthesis